MVRVAAALATALAVGLIGFLLLRASKWRMAKPSRQQWTVTAGLDVSPFQFWVASIGAGAATFLVVFGLTSLPFVALMPAVVVATLPKAYFSRKRAERLARVQEAWPDGLRDVIASVRSGASLQRALEDLASFGPPPLRDAFQGFGVYSRSLGVVSALEMIRSDLADATSDRVVEVLILAHERGGSVVPEILGDLAEATTRDSWTLEQIRTEILEQKINSRVVFVLPWFVLIAMTAQSAAFREFYSSPLGVAVIVVGGLASLLGLVIASKLGRQPAEPRVVMSGKGAQ
jgi:tight adherence protein B